MAAQKFSLDNLKNLDFGKISHAFNAEVQRIVQDCMDRPGLEKNRQVSIVFDFWPVTDPAQGLVDCETVGVEAQVTSKIPARKTKVYSMRPHKNGELSFNPDMPEDPDGRTLYNDDERRLDGE